MIEKQTKLKSIIWMNKDEKLKQLASCCSKLLEDELTLSAIEDVCYIHLKHHFMGMDIQSDLNTMPHYITIAP